MATRLRTNSGDSALTCSLSISMFTTTPPTGMPNSLNQSMKRVITAMGSASGRVTKKKAVFSLSVSSSLAWAIRAWKESR